MIFVALCIGVADRSNEVVRGDPIDGAEPCADASGISIKDIHDVLG